jgi:nucleotide-binding universal stress UspA family protein
MRLAELQGAELILLHVGPEDEASQEEYRRAALARLHSLIPTSMKLSPAPKLIVEFGPASECIIQVANDQKPHLIVLGVRQPEGFARRVRWATAYDVVTNAPCPVLTVRTPDQDV